MTKTTPTSTSLYIQHIAILTVGFLAGISTAYIINLLPFNFSGAIDRAKALGITSISIMQGHAESKDVLLYILILVFSTATPLTAWYFWFRGNRRDILKEFFSRQTYTPQPGRNSMWIVCLSAILIFYVFISFNINGFYFLETNLTTKGWPFFGEEGLFLSYAQSIISGEVFGKDFESPYGPALIYPLVWMMNFFGETVIVARIYVYILNILAFGIFVFFLYKTLRLKSIFILAAVLYEFVYPAFSVNAPNNSYFRVMFGILPILFAYLEQTYEKRYYMPLAGILLAASFLVSYEVGICSALSIAVFFIVIYISSEDRKHIKKKIILFSGGFIIVLLSAAAYFAYKGALIPLVESFYKYSIIYSLGHASLPFPDFDNFVGSLLKGEIALQYWIILVYVLSLLYIIPSLFLKTQQKRAILIMTLAVFGILIFRKALGRSDAEQALRVSQPAFLLIIIFIDSAVLNLIKKTPRPVFAANILLLTLIFITSVSLYTGSTLLKAHTSIASAFSYNFKTKWSVMGLGYKVPQIIRTGGIYFERETADTLIKLNDFFTKNSAVGDKIYFFPNEAAYYFLFDKPCPTKYPLTHMAATKHLRQDLINDLEISKPQYVIYSLNTWRVDNISETIYAPEVLRYLQSNYAIHKQLKDIIILKRILA